MNQNIYNGVMTTPSDDFSSVRDGRRSRLLYFDVDLSITRTLDDLSALILPISGNFFYVDQNPLFAGFATVGFEDTNSDSTPVYVGPGTLSRVPYTRLKISNLSQPGKLLRIIYGVDIDFEPAMSAIQNVSIVGSIRASGESMVSTSATAASLTAAPILTVAGNGINLHSCYLQMTTTAVNNAVTGGITTTGSPANIMYSTAMCAVITTPYEGGREVYPVPIFIPVGVVISVTNFSATSGVTGYIKYRQL